MFEHFSASAIKILMIAQDSSRQRKVTIVEEYDLLLALTKVDGEAKDFLNTYGMTLTLIKCFVVQGNEYNLPVELPFSVQARKVLEESCKYAVNRKVEPVDILYALCNNWYCFDLLEKAGVNVKEMEHTLESSIFNKNNATIAVLPSTKNISRRDYFAAAALTGLIAGDYTERSLQNVVETSIEFADELIKQLDKETSND